MGGKQPNKRRADRGEFVNGPASFAGFEGAAPAAGLYDALSIPGSLFIQEVFLCVLCGRERFNQSSARSSVASVLMLSTHGG